MVLQLNNKELLHRAATIIMYGDEFPAHGQVRYSYGWHGDASKVIKHRVIWYPLVRMIIC